MSEHDVNMPDVNMLDEPTHAEGGWKRTGRDFLEPTHFLDYLKVLTKRRWTVLTASLPVVLFVTVHTFTVTPQYEARTRILIEDVSANIVAFQEVIEETLTQNDYYRTQLRLLEGRSLARKTLDTLQLWDHPAFLVEIPSDDESLGGGGAAKIATGEAGTDTVAQSIAIDRFLGRFSARAVRGSRLVDLIFRSEDPILATTIVSTHAQAFVEQNLEFKFVASQQASQWLTERLADQRQAVEESEAALYAYRQEHDAISLEDSEDIVIQKLAELNAAVTRAKTELIGKEAEYLQLESIKSDMAALDTLPAIASNGFIQSLKSELAELEQQRAELGEELGPRHPNMIRIVSAVGVAEARLEQEIDKVVQSVRNDYLSSQAEERSLARELEAQKNEALALNRVGIGYGVLAREAEGNRQLYESLLQRAKETGVSAELRNSNIRIVDAAEVPRSPASPRVALNLLAGLLGGVILGIGLAFFFEYLDNRIKTPDEIRTHLGLPSLGLIPSIPRRTLKTVRSPLLNNGVPADFSEAFRTARTAVLFSCADNKGSFVVTSTGPGEGKSVVTSNLAIGFAKAERRVLLIDADLRRPTQHEAFGLDQEPGLSNLIVGEAKTSNALRKTSIPGLWLLPAGRIPPDPAELLGSKRFKAFLASLPEHFDTVLLDTPPVMAVTDAAVVAHATAGVIFVVGAEMTSRHAAQQALEQLDAASAKFVGAILNRVDLRRNAYYYSRYYRSEYQQYYVQQQPPEAARRRPGSTLQL